MLDRKRGSLLLLLYALSMLAGFMVPSFPAYNNYCIELKIAFFLSFIVVWVIAYCFEYIMSSLQDDAIQSNIKIKKLNEDLKQLAECDGLTGTYNRRFFNEYFEIEVKRAKSFIEHKAHLEPSQRNDMNFGLAILDIDHFKLINDTYGHLVGDSVLKQITDIMKENMFSRDVLCRYGGDEFVMLLTKTSPDGILQAAEKIRKEIDEHMFVFDEHSRCQHVTISVGLVIFNEVLDKKSGDILKLADDRLLTAKSRGKNRVVYSDSV
jgi:diguanylate cyclase (GGDEF)-like protein